MKTIINFKTAAIAFMLIFSVATANTFAGTKTESPAELKYVGTTNNQPVFSLSLHNSQDDEFLIVLKNNFGEQIYSETVSGKEIERRYRLNSDAIDAGGITVVVTSKKNNSKITYSAQRQTRTVEDVVINKL